MDVRRSRFSSLLPALVAVLAIVTCRGDQGPASPTSPVTVLRPSFSTGVGAVTLVGSGNIARCDRTNDEATAKILDGITGTVFTLGDAAYPNGTAANYTNCYDPTWGRQKARTYPVPGHHDYDSSSTAAGYFGYFGAAAGDATKGGYYSYDLGAWHIIVLNSNSKYVSTAAGSPQETWLRSDLAANTKQCILAMWHHPRFYSTTSSSLSPTSSVKPFWDDLYNAHATLILNAHMRDYERFGPQTPTGAADSVGGIREIIVGTGGEGLDATNTLIAPNSQVRISGVYGVLQLTLADGSYTFQFLPVSGQTATDFGGGACYGAGPSTPIVNAGPDVLTYPGDTVSLAATFSDPGPNDGPWTYAITWGDGTSTSGTTTSSSTPITASHVYSTLTLDSVRVTVTNAYAMAGSDSLAVQAANGPAVLVGAGDIADSSTKGDSLTANLLDGIAGTVYTLGDNAYQIGSSTEFTSFYHATWGRQKARTRPVPGNHDYSTTGAAGYFGYFGAAAGDPATGYYSYDIGDWHIIALNSELDVTPGSAQVQWLRSDLALHSKLCTLAYWHEPRFVSGVNITSNPKYQTLWDTLYQYGADVVLGGHKHSYERFAPQNPAAQLDTLYGIREFVVGTGGTGLDGGNPTPIANSEVRNTNTWGVLKVTLNSGSYTWQFVPVAGMSFSDAGSGLCHGAPPATNHPPTAVPGGPYSGNEGAAVSFNGSGSSDPDGDALTYAWTFGDGATGTGVAPSHAYADNGTYTVTLVVTDTHGAASAPATTTATIANVAPSVNAGPNQTVTAGATLTLNATLSDPGVSDAPWAYTINWGDGTAPTTGSTTSQSSAIAATHSYSAAGTAVVQVTVTDKDAGVGSGSATMTITQPVASVTLVGAGNIARCDRTNDDATANILDGIAGTVFALGDAAYPNGTAANYTNCYDPTWGRQKARTYPVPGNHDYDSSATAAGYFGYFGAAAGDPTKGYYSYDLGAWHVIMLNSNNAYVSTAAGSPQETWLKADLAATTKQCVLAMWHNPRFYSTTSSTFSPTSSVKPFWDDLYAAHAELILNAHMRDYERFAPQTSAGIADPVNGIREIIVGTGGEGLDSPNTLIIPNSEVNISGVYGVLKLTLYDGSYSWQFVPVAGQTATDSGSASCH